MQDRAWPLRWLFLCVVGTSACGRNPGVDPSHPVTITISGLGLDHAEELRRDALDALTRKTGIQTWLVPTAGTSTDQLAQTLRLLNRHADTPDVYVIDVIWPGTLGGNLLDLKPLLDLKSRDADAGAHLPALLKNDTVGGRLVSLPFYLNVGMLYFRRDLLSKYGYSHPPDTWDELERMAARIQERERSAGNPDFWGYVWQGASYEGLTCNALEWQAAFGGGHLIEPDGIITVNNPNTVRALRHAMRWVGTISPPSVLSYTEADSLSAFRSGNAAFLRYWSGGVSLAALGARFGVALLPAGPYSRAQTMGGFQLAVSRYSAHPREAVSVVTWLTGGDVQLRRALHRGFLPTLPRLYERPELSKALPQADALRRAGLEAWVARPSTIAGPKYAAVSQAYFQTVHKILRRALPPAEALASLEKELAGITGFRVGAPRN